MRQTWFRQFDELYFVSELSVGCTYKSPNMVWTVWGTIFCFLTDLLMRCELQPELHCAGCTETCVHMLTHDTCSLSSFCSWKPRQWTPWLCHAFTYSLVFICWVPQITLTLPQVHKWGHFLRSERLRNSYCQPCVAVPVSSSSVGELSGFNQWDARFVKLNEQFPEHVKWSVLDPEHSFVTVLRTAQTKFAK